MALIAAHLNAGHSGGDSVAIGIYSHSSPFPPFSPSLISLMVSVDVKHHVYLLTYFTFHTHFEMGKLMVCLSTTEGRAFEPTRMQNVLYLRLSGFVCLFVCLLLY